MYASLETYLIPIPLMPYVWNTNPMIFLAAPEEVQEMIAETTVIQPQLTTGTIW